jgi:lipopolysaccharide/colanic/teichoic acid biosynthesis glycosyltransferase
MKQKAIYIGENISFVNRLKMESDELEISLVKNCLDIVSMDSHTSLVIFEEIRDHDMLDLVKFLNEYLKQFNIPCIVISQGYYSSLEYLSHGAFDVYNDEVRAEDILNRLRFFLKNSQHLQEIKTDNLLTYKLPLWKRAFDIAFASLAILFLSPLFILLAILIRLESKGKVFYAAPRVGSGYRIFGFYKFRSMYHDADQRLDKMMKNNQYGSHEETGNQKKTGHAGPYLLRDEGYVRESEFLDEKKIRQENGFVKFANDPRITRVGRLLRNTSIDELPQLFNILRGDMSIVGNRPLPLYEAEMLTDDQWAERFLAPAGLTGLWQVTKRGGSNKMSAAERKQLDIDYINKLSFWLDLIIILKTIPAMIQHENV